MRKTFRDGEILPKKQDLLDIVYFSFFFFVAIILIFDVINERDFKYSFLNVAYTFNNSSKYLKKTENIKRFYDKKKEKTSTVYY